jgi:TAG lipase / lysophosphatidylethanolamine acyltransferase
VVHTLAKSTYDLIAILQELFIGPFLESREARDLRQALKYATTYEEWSSIARQLDDSIPRLFAWKHDSRSTEYEYIDVQNNLQAIREATEADDAHRMKKLLHSAVRHGPYGIGRSQLFEKLYGGTKLLIEQYVVAVLECLHRVVEIWSQNMAALPNMENLIQLKLSARRTALILQGGSVLAIYQLGVVKGLLQRELLPKLIIGTGVGAAAAGLVAVLTDDELQNFLSDSDDLLEACQWNEGSRRIGLLPRLRGFCRSGFILDQDALLRLVDTKLEDMTFEEAKGHTGREVCITIAADSPGAPGLLSYMTAPNVLIRSAVRAAMILDFDKAMGTILEKDFDGRVQKWTLDDETPEFRIRRRKKDRKEGKISLLYEDRALNRANQIFDINHYITSQARPLAIPFTRQAFNRSQVPTVLPYLQFLFENWVVWMFLAEVQFFIKWIWAPMWLQKLIYDVKTSREDVKILPSIGLKELWYLLRNPDKEMVEHWISLGEKSVWPCVAAIKTRCQAELALQRYADQMQQEDRRAWFLARRKFEA